MSEPFGSATVARDADGVRVLQADPTIGVSPNLWEDVRGTEHRPDDETLVLDSDGEYRYTLRGEHTDAFGHRWLVFDRDKENP